MEQLIDAKTLVQTSESIPFRHNTRQGSPRAWARLNRASLNLRHAADHHLALDPQDFKAQRFDIMKTRLLRQVTQNGLRRVGITSSASGCGKSMIVANLALSLSRERDFRTLVFDFNLRAPGLISTFGLERIGPKYSALRSSRRSFDSTAMRLSDTLAISLNGTSEPDACQILSSAHTKRLLAEIEAAFEPDLVLFDLPALFPSADAQVALGMMDAALLVVEAERSTFEEVDAGERTVAEHTKCLGVVLNRCRAPARAFAHGA